MSQNHALDVSLGGLMSAFPRTRWAIIGFVAGVFTWSFAGGGPQPRATDKVDGEAVETAVGTVGTVDSTVHKFNQGIQDLTASVRKRLADVQGSAHHMNLEAVVRDRLVEDETIDADRIEVQVKDEGTVVLHGQVPDKEAKESAVDLTRGIEGVTRIEDHLSVPPATRVIAVKDDEEPPVSRYRRTR